jgi:hypothetical protein
VYTLNQVAGSTDLVDPANFTLAAWDPADPTTSGTSSTRSFDLPDDGNFRAIDGFTVTGHIEAIPLPTDTFTMHYGRVAIPDPPNAGGWTTNETAGASTNVAGDFSLAITFPGNQTPSLSGNGPTFEDAVLGTGSSTAHSGRSDLFAVQLVGAYTGAEPVAHVKLVINSISIYGARLASLSGGDGFSWRETTVGNEATTSVYTLNQVAGSADLVDPANFTLAAWDPADPTTRGTSSTRSFDLPDDGNFRAIDGFTVMGRIEVIPEPTAILLVGVGLGCLLLRRARRA